MNAVLNAETELKRKCHGRTGMETSSPLSQATPLTMGQAARRVHGNDVKSLELPPDKGHSKKSSLY